MLGLAAADSNAVAVRRAIAVVLSTDLEINMREFVADPSGNGRPKAASDPVYMFVTPFPAGDAKVINMKSVLLALGMVLGMLQCVEAGGNSSIVNITVTSIAIEDRKITIKGSGMLQKRVMSDAEHGDASCFGQPAQMLYAKVQDAVFEVIPYHEGGTEITGVPMGRPNEEAIERSLKWWKGTLDSAKQIKVGDKLQIGYQRERMTISGVHVTHILGSGSLRVQND